jgi:hypothetical protein
MARPIQPELAARHMGQQPFGAMFRPQPPGDNPVLPALWRAYHVANGRLLPHCRRLLHRLSGDEERIFHRRQTFLRRFP